MYWPSPRTRSCAPPVPLDTAGVSQEALSLTCHEQLEPVVSVTLPEPAAAGSVSVVGLTPYVHDVPCCVTVTGVPATVTCADRADCDVLAVTANETVAVPVPLVMDGVSQVAFSLTCHVQPEVVVTVTLPEPAAAGSVSVAGATVYAHAAPCWVTVTAVPATVSCADLADVEVLAVTENETVALPVPLDTEGVSQVALSLTCQVQPEVVVSVTLPEPAAAGSVSVVGLTPYVHDVPCCVTVTGVPATVTCADRADCDVLAVTANETVAVPVPLVVDGVSQVAFSLTCQVQPEVVVTVMVPEPAAA